jgi:hypothetical protein
MVLVAFMDLHQPGHSHQLEGGVGDVEVTGRALLPRRVPT